MTAEPGAAHRYRPDVDGLRAIAVLAVVGFHAAPRFVAGGFVGVDVFFVISGYLISGILFDEVRRRGAVDLAAFYVRRIRRIFPALTVVLIAVAVGTRLILTNTDYADVQRHVAAGSVFVSNILLWREAGYFDAPARLKPLLHLWSLGIEEQFYLCWPPIIYLCTRWRRSSVGVCIAVAVLSFGLNAALVRSAPSAVFYLPFTRMWELLLGALLAYPRGDVHGGGIIPRPLAAIGAAAGLACVVAATILLSDRALFPGWWALVPTVGTALVIAAGSSAWPNRLLAWRPLVFIGLISYPLYLWHWPLLFALQITEGGAPSNRLKIAAVALSFVLATLTYLAIERPIRKNVTPRTLGAVAAIAASLFFVGGLSFYSLRTGRLTPAAPYLVAGVYSRVPSPRVDAVCRARYPIRSEYCQIYGSGPITTVLLGNSHAEHYIEGVGAYLAARGENVVHLGQSGCAPLVDLQRFVNDTNDTCREPDNALIAMIANSPDIHRVVLSFNGTTMANGTGPLGGYEMMVLAGTMLPSDESIRVALERTAQLFLAKGKSVWLLLQVPEMEFNLAECMSRPFSFEKRVRTPCATPLANVVAREARYREIVADAQAHVPGLKVFDPRPALCDSAWCYAMRDGQLLYADDHHLSREGSRLFSTKFEF